MLENANRSFLGGPVRVGILCGLMCTLLLLAHSVASGQRVRKPTQPVSKIGDKDRAREHEVIPAQPLNSIEVEVRYRTEYGYKYDSGVFAGSGPTSCDAFFISAGPDPSVRQAQPYAIHKIDKMRESNGFYICDFLVTDLPLSVPITAGVDLADHRSSPFETWKGGNAAQPPPGQQRTIIIVGGKASGISRVEAENFAAQDGTRTVTLSEAEPRATLVFEMVYAPATRVIPIDKKPGAAWERAVEGIKNTGTESTANELRCRGGGGLRFNVGEGRTNSSGEQTMYMRVRFNPAAQSASSGLNLQPGQCAYSQRAVRVDEPYEIILEVVSFGQTRQQLHGTPVDTSPTAAERYPDAQNVPQYLGDEKHYWSFFVQQNGPLPSGRFEASSVGRYWKPLLSGEDTVRPIDSKRTNKHNPQVLPLP